MYLAYETALDQPLQLPVSAQDMLYARLSKVTLQDVKAARQEAERADKDVRRQEAFLLAWDPWRAYQRGQTAARLGWQQLQHAPAEAGVADAAR